MTKKELIKEYLKKKKLIIKRYDLKILRCGDLDYGTDLVEKKYKKLSDLIIEYREKINLLK